MCDNITHIMISTSILKKATLKRILTYVFSCILLLENSVIQDKIKMQNLKKKLKYLHTQRQEISTTSNNRKCFNSIEFFIPYLYVQIVFDIHTRKFNIAENTIFYGFKLYMYTDLQWKNQILIGIRIHLNVSIISFYSYFNFIFVF